MKLMRRLMVGMFAVALAAGTVGCFGENLLSAALKVANGQMSQLTASEILQLNQAAIAVLGQQSGQQLEPMTEEQAQAFADFLKANDVNTVEDFEQLTQQAEQDPESLEGLSELGAAFQGSNPDFDPENVESEDLEDIFNQTFSR